MPSLKERSALGVYIAHCERGELAYQVCTDNNWTIFCPCVASPRTASPNLECQVSGGLWTVYATTVVYYKGEAPLNVALIDLDEGFRMMSRVEDIHALEVKSGLRVKVLMHPGTEKQPPYPVFVPVKDGP